MNRRRRTSVLAMLAAAATTTALSLPSLSYAAPGGTGNGNGSGNAAAHAPTKGPTAPFGCNARAKGNAKKDQVSGDGYMRAAQAAGADGQTGPLVTSAPTGYAPADIGSAYGLTGLTPPAGTDGKAPVVAIVDAYDDPKAESDLATYRSQFGLPACTTANGCFTKVGQDGSSRLPKADYGWGLEISLDLDMVSATCPGCRILLVEASTANTPDIAAAVDTAAAHPDVVAISNSYGGPEDGSELTYSKSYHHPGIAVTASTGDSGYGVSYPATDPHVIAVGGTSLSRATTARGWSETAWSGAGSGCSSDMAQPSFQAGLTTTCTKRAIGDVSAVADPNTGVAVYDTASSCGTGALCNLLISLGLAQGATGWVQVGGTSASSPIIASVYALAGHTASVQDASGLYANRAKLWDVTSGSNGSCSEAALCTARTGWDGPTGLGTPNGIGAF